MQDSNNKRQFKGTVVSDKMNKTRVVAVERLKKHSKYGKYFRVTRRYKAHDEENAFQIGDKVVLAETRPLSKKKKWNIIGKI